MRRSSESNINKGDRVKLSDLKNLMPGMDQGAGDNNAATGGSLNPPKENEQGAAAPAVEDVDSMPGAFKNLQLSEPSPSGSKKEKSIKLDDPLLASPEPDEDDTGTSSEDEDDSSIEPLCSYPYGYIKRQTVYVCLTCNDPSKEDWKPAGICIGCRHACHQGHDIVSLETRRNFRCDCGNKSFPNGASPCLLCPEKSDTNAENIYSNDYKGTFCTCKCKENDCIESDPLYQCVVCEDWYHADHCDIEKQGIEKNYTDLICGACTKKLDFLRFYDPFHPDDMTNETVITEMLKYAEMESGSEDESEEPPAPPPVDSCKLKALVKKPAFSKGRLWTLGWRNKLCRCIQCREMYKQMNVSFLLDKDDETRRYFEDDNEDEIQNKVCNLIRKFEEWLLQMSADEREELFNAGQEAVKAKMMEYFTQLEKEGDEEFGEELLNQLFQCFTEYVLEDEDGMDYLFDVDALDKIFKVESPSAKGDVAATASEGAADNIMSDTAGAAALSEKNA